MLHRIKWYNFGYLQHHPIMEVDSYRLDMVYDTKIYHVWHATSLLFDSHSYSQSDDLVAIQDYTTHYDANHASRIHAYKLSIRGVIVNY